MRRPAGFTLLELLLVVLILSLVAFGSVTVLEGREDQIRYDETKNQLLQIRAAILGPAEEIAAGVTSGHVNDMGVLPDEDLEALLRKPTSADLLYPQEPVWHDGESDELGLVVRHPTSGDILVDPGVRKGWRGPYLLLPPGTDPEVDLPLDGWGGPITLQAWEDDDGDDWLKVLSLGSDRQAGGTEVYEVDLDCRFRDPQGWKPKPTVHARIRNTDGSDSPELTLTVVWFETDTWKYADKNVGNVPASDYLDVDWVLDDAVPVGRQAVALLDESETGDDRVVDAASLVVGARGEPGRLRLEYPR